MLVVAEYWGASSEGILIWTTFPMGGGLGPIVSCGSADRIDWKLSVRKTVQMKSITYMAAQESMADNERGLSGPGSHSYYPE